MSTDFKAFIHFEITGAKKAKLVQDALENIGVQFDYAKKGADEFAAELNNLSVSKLNEVESAIKNIKQTWGKKYGPMHGAAFDIKASGKVARTYKNDIIERQKAAEVETKVLEDQTKKQIEANQVASRKRIEEAQKAREDARENEVKYTAWWSSQLDARDAKEKKALEDTQKKVEATRKNTQKQIEQEEKTRQDARKNEIEYTAWWTNELNKKDDKEKKSNDNRRKNQEKKRKDDQKAIEDAKRLEIEYTLWWENELQKRENAEEREINKAGRERRAGARRREREDRQETLRIQRELNERLRRIRGYYTAANRIQHITQGGGGGGTLGGFPIVRLFIFDSIRRMITGLYQGVSMVGGKLVEWTIEGIKFNDEMKRAQTYFTGLGLLGTKGALGGQMTVGEARGSKDPAVRDALRRSEEISQRMMTKMMEVSAQTGQDLDEIVVAARQSASDLLNKMNKPGQPNQFLQKPELFEDITTRLVKLSSVLRMADPQNRKLGFHLVGLQEFFSGTSGSPKSEGAALALSLMRREGLRVGKEYTKIIADAVNAGDLKKAMDTLEEVLTNAGVGIEQIANFMDNTLSPSISSTIMMLRRLNMELTKEFTDKGLSNSFRGIKNYLLALSEYPRFMEILQRVSRNFNITLFNIAISIGKMVDRLVKNPDLIESTMMNTVTAIGSSINLAMSIFAAAGALVAGIFSSDMTRGMDDLATRIMSNLPFFYALGASIMTLSSQIMENIIQIIRFATMIMVLGLAMRIVTGIVTTITAIMTVFSVVGGLAAAVIAGIVILIAGIAAYFGHDLPDRIMNMITSPFNELFANMQVPTELNIDTGRVPEQIADSIASGVQMTETASPGLPNNQNRPGNPPSVNTSREVESIIASAAAKTNENKLSPNARYLMPNSLMPVEGHNRYINLPAATPTVAPRQQPPVEVRKKIEIKKEQQVIQINGPITISASDPKKFAEDMFNLAKSRPFPPIWSSDQPEFNSARPDAHQGLDFGVL
jgi:hypothetical protein